MLTPLREALRGLLAGRLPAEAAEGVLDALAQRLRAGLQKLRPNKQLAPWMAGVAGKVVNHDVGPSSGATGEDQIANALVPFLDLLSPEHAEVLRLTDHGALTQRAAATRLGVSLVTLMSRVHAARRRLRHLVLAGLKLLAPDTSDTAVHTIHPADTRPPRRHVPANALLPAFTTALEDLVRFWVAPEHVAATAAALVTRLRVVLDTPRRQTRLGLWLHGILRATLVAAPWARTLPSHPKTAPTPADLQAIATVLAPLLATLTAEQSGAILLFDLSNRSLHAAAHEGGTDRSTLQNRLQRARIRLLRLLSDILQAEMSGSAATA